MQNASDMATVASRARGSAASRWLDNRNVLGVLFLFPAAALLLLFLTYPLGLGTWLGFTDAKVVSVVVVEGNDTIFPVLGTLNE